MFTASLHLTSRDISLPHFQNGTAILDSHHVFLQRHFVDRGTSATRPAYRYHYHSRANHSPTTTARRKRSDRRRQPLRRELRWRRGLVRHRTLRCLLDLDRVTGRGILEKR